MSKLRIVPGPVWDPTDEQVRIVNEGLETTKSTVVPIEGEFDSYIVLDGNHPVGMLSVMPINQYACEFGVRFWDKRMTAARVMGRAVRLLFDVYDYVLARCYATNMDVRHLVQRVGFILLDVQKFGKKNVHVYGCRKEDFYRVTPEGIFSDG